MLIFYRTSAEISVTIPSPSRHHPVGTLKISVCPRRFPSVIHRLPGRIKNRYCRGGFSRSFFPYSLDTMKHIGGLQSADNKSANRMYPHSIYIGSKTDNSAENTIAARLPLVLRTASRNQESKICRRLPIWNRNLSVLIQISHIPLFFLPFLSFLIPFFSYLIFFFPLFDMMQT